MQIDNFINLIRSGFKYFELLEHDEDFLQIEAEGFKYVNSIESIDFQFDLNSDDDISKEDGVQFNLKIDDGIKALDYKEDLVPRSERNIISNYIDEKGKNIVVFDVDGKPIKAIKYDHGYYYPKEPKEKKIIIKQPKITYNKIKEYVKEKYNLKVHSTYIAEIKRKYGLDMQSYRTIEDARHISCPPEKAKAIEEALRYYNLI